jgi:mono/diheme cytochrome c family protein
MAPWSSRRRRCAGLALALPVLGCDDDLLGATEEAVEGSGYEAVVEIINTNCVSCHSAAGASSFGNLDLETDPCGALVNMPASAYDGVLVQPGDHSSSVFWAKVDGSNYGTVMPPAGRMADGNVNIIAQWIDDGAECDPFGGADGSDGGSNSTYTMDRVQAEIFDVSCTVCHSGDAPSSGLDLSDGVARANLVEVWGAYDQVLVVPGDPDGSFLFQKMIATAPVDGHGDPMPPAGPLSTDAITLVFGWIYEGAAP